MLLLAGSLTDAQTIKRSKQQPKTEKTQKQNKSNSNSTKQNTKPKKQNNNTHNEKVKEGANTTIEISISSNASDASVYIDDIYNGSIGGLYEVSPGSHKIMIIANGYETHESTIYVSSSHTSFNCHLNEITYVVTFKCNVSYASLSIDETVVGFANGQYSLSPGSHSIRIMYSGYEDKTDVLSVYSDTLFNYELIPIKKTINDSQPEIQAKTITVKGVSFDMIFVEGGVTTKQKTGENNSFADLVDKSTQQVMLSGYYIGEHEVTQELWEAVMGSNPSQFKNNSQNPVENVTWDNCQMFVEKLNQITGKQFRLPTEAEWDFAAHGGNYSRGYKYAGSNNLEDVAWYDGNSGRMTHPVGLKSPNELGIYDMSGNVREWCQDVFKSKSQTNAQASSRTNVQFVPGVGWCVGPAVSLSGSQSLIHNHVFRSLDDPISSHHFIGLRLAASSL